jgi:hypothetical protein
VETVKFSQLITVFSQNWLKEKVLLVDITKSFMNFETIYFVIDQEFFKKKRFTVGDVEDLIRNRWSYEKIGDEIFSVPAD